MGSQGAHPACLFLGVTMLLTVAATVLLCTAVLTNHWEVITINRPLLEALVDKQSSHSLTWLFGGIVAKVTVWEAQSSNLHSDRAGVRTLGRESRSLRMSLPLEGLRHAMNASQKPTTKELSNEIIEATGDSVAKIDLSPNDEESQYVQNKVLVVWPQISQKYFPERNSFRTRLPTNQIEKPGGVDVKKRSAFSNRNVDFFYKEHGTENGEGGSGRKKVENLNDENSSKEDSTDTKGCTRRECISVYTTVALPQDILQKNKNNLSLLKKPITYHDTTVMEILDQKSFSGEMTKESQDDHKYVLQPTLFRKFRTKSLPHESLPIFRPVERENYFIRSSQQTRDFLLKTRYPARQPSATWSTYKGPLFGGFQVKQRGKSSLHDGHRRSYHEFISVVSTVSDNDASRRLFSKKSLPPDALERKLPNEEKHLENQNAYLNSLRSLHSNNSATLATKPELYLMKTTAQKIEGNAPNMNIVLNPKIRKDNNSENGDGRRSKRSAEKVMFLTPLHGGIWTMCIDLTKEQQQNLTEQGFLMSGCVNYLGPPDPTRPDKNDWIQRMQNLSISCALVTCILLASCALVGLFGILNRQISAVLVTGVMYILATIFAVFCLAIMHFKRRTKKDCANLDPQVSPYLNAARVFSTSWSLSLGWAGAVTCLGAALLWLLLARIMRYNPISLS